MTRTDQEKEAMAADYKAGAGLHEIASKYRINSTWARHILIAQGVEIRKPGRPWPKKESA